jgi:superfamily I DNA/RNA helicase
VFNGCVIIYVSLLTRAEWVQRLQDVLNKFDVRRQAGRWAREIVAFYKLQDTLVDLAKPEAELIGLEDFAWDVIDSLALLTVPAQPGRGGVELHTPPSLFGAEFKHVFVLGAAEGILPAPVQDDPVLDFHERKQLLKHGFPLEGAAQAARREAISFYALPKEVRESESPVNSAAGMKDDTSGFIRLVYYLTSWWVWL